MKLTVYSLFDAAASAFSQPFFMQNDGLAIRAFQDNINGTESTNITEHPDQFTLFKVASWDDSEGKFTPYDTPKSLALGVSLLNSDAPRYSDNELNKISEALEKQNRELQQLKLSINNTLAEQEAPHIKLAE